MNRIRLLGLAAFLVPGALAAQQMAAPAANPVTAAAQGMHKRFSGFLTSAADEIPADKLSYKPTDAQMTFGHIWAHLADANFGICSAIGGMKAPTHPSYKGTEAKDALVSNLKASFAFCDQAFAHTDDSNLGENVDLGFMHGSRALAMFIYVEDLADHYSQVANYMRLNGMLPPSARRGGD